MGWFDDQLRQRKQIDDEVFEKAFIGAADAVLGQRFSFDGKLDDDSLSHLAKYYRVHFPQNMTDPASRLEHLCREKGLMQRSVALTEGWFKNAYGPLLATRVDTGAAVALIPGGYQKYYYHENGKRHRIGPKNQKLFASEAVFFYTTLPAKKLDVIDLVRYALSSRSRSDMIYIWLAMGIITLVGLLTPKLNYFLFDTVVNANSITLLGSTMVFMVCTSLSILLLTTLKSLALNRMSSKMSNAVESATMARILSLPADFFKQYTAGEINQRMSYITAVCDSLINTVFSGELTGLFSLVYITQIVVYAPALVVPALIVIAVNVLFSLVSTLYQMKITKKRMEISAKNSGVSLAMISGVEKIKLAGAEKRMFARWGDGFSEELRITYNPPLFLKLNAAISLFLSLAGLFCMYYLAIQSQVTTAEFYAFQTAYSMVSAAFATLASVALTAADLKPALEMAKPILEAVPETGDKNEPVTALRGGIELNHISFRYTDTMPYVVDDFSMKIHAGQYVAIVGKTGCGKSTLIRLLLGFEKPQKGAIYYDGRDINSLEKKSLRRNIGTVMQDDKLFMGDLYSNIVICAPQLSVDDAWEAAELAGIADDIRAMPMGMHTLISDGSGGISGGQRQRLMIARAIAPKPKILIFDEATSALDNITQKKISDALDGLKCTRIVVAHRLSTIRHCDRILVMDKGHIVEDGSYEQLMALGGIFADLVARQQLDRPAEASGDE